ncbi:MAG: cell wall metabolism sensor histidine kinase WalK [Armatimonadetes bacterium]|nr:cell wall metabolism sensor histidine kinase WalK [Armatimonadota bacterium]
MKSLNSIQTKLVFTYLVLIFFSTSITYMFFVPRIQSYLLERAENHLRRESQVIANIITNTYTFADANLALVAEDIRKNFSSVQGMRVRVYDPEGTLVADSATKIPHRRVIGDDARQGLLGKQVTWVETDDGHRTLHVSNPLKAPGRVFGVVDLAVQIGDQETIAEIRNTMMWALAISILASWIVGFLLARTIVDPISRIRSAAHRIAEGDLAHRVPTGGKDELSDLGHAINHMAAQLESRIGEIVSEKNKMNSLLETLIDGVVALDSENRVSFLNHVAEKLLNIKSDEVIGEPLTAVFDYPPLKSLLAECVEKEALLSREIVREGSNLKLFFLPFKDERKLHHGTMMVIRDITDLRRLEEARQQFFGAVSHELRTPMTIIKGFVVTLLDTETVAADEELKRPLEMIDRETDRLSRLVNDILELSSLRSKKMSLELSPIDAEEHVGDTLLTLKSHAERVGVELIADLARAHSRIVADPDRFRQIVLNLVDNSIKYTPTGGEVRVITRRLEDDWLLEIRDTGVGIPQEEIPFLFERFFRSKDKKKKSSIRGTGLGLAIVRELVDSHMANIDVTSEVGKGTVVRLTFPLRLLPEQQRERIRKSQGSTSDGEPPRAIRKPGDTVADV